MKKLMLFLSLLLAMGGQAQAQQAKWRTTAKDAAHLNRTTQHTEAISPTLKKRANDVFVSNVTFALPDARLGGSALVAPCTARKAGEYTTEVVNEFGLIMAPAAGEERTYERAGNCLVYNYMQEVCVPSVQSGGLTLVECADGTVYMKQPVSCYGLSYAGDSWIKGKREGRQLVFPASQKVNYTSAFGMDASMSVCRGNYNAKADKQFDPDRETPIVFSETDDGHQLFLEGTDDQHIVGVFWDDDNSFTGYGDYETELALNAEAYDEPLVTPPADLATTDFIIECTDYRTGEKVSQWCTMGFDGDDVYLTGFSFYMPEVWIKGTREDNRLTFPREQYVGKDAGYDMYVYGGYLSDGGAAISDLYFIYNEAKQTYTSPSGLLLTRGKVTSSIVLAEYLSAIRIYPEGKGEEVAVDIRYDVPQGTLKTYARTGGSYYTFFGYILDGRQEGKHIDIVYDDDDDNDDEVSGLSGYQAFRSRSCTQPLNLPASQPHKTVYMMNPISQASTEPGAWIEGYIGSDGRIHMPLGQYTYQDPDSGLAMQTAVLRLTVSGDPFSPTLDYVYDNSFSEVTFTIGDDGSLTLDPLTDEVIYEGYPSMVYGLIYDDDYTWTGYADYDTRYLPFADTFATIPAGVKAETWAYMYNDGTNDVASEVRIGISGDKLYLAGLNQNAPAAAIVGSIAREEGSGKGTVSFASDQYVANSAYDIFLYFVGAQYTDHEAYDEEFDYHYTYRTYEYLPTLVFDYDEGAKRLTTNGNVAIVVNQGQGSTGVFTPTAVGLQPSFVGFEESAATPAAPSVLDYGSYYDDYGYDVAEFYVPTKDTEGRYIRTDKLYYIIWTTVDGTTEPLVFSPEEYEGLDRQLTEVPYDLTVTNTSGWSSIIAGAKRIILFTPGYDNIGIQSIYYGAGERRATDIVWWKPSEAGIALPLAPSAHAAVYTLDGRRLPLSHESQGGQRGIRITHSRKMIIR